MEKLIELLNEYLDDGQERLYACYPLDEDFDKFFHTKDGEGTIEEAQVISKKFGFIKRLIEHDKIDLLKLTCMNPIYTEILDSDFFWEERIIMVLSVEDNPIEFLVSILK